MRAFSFYLSCIVPSIINTVALPGSLDALRLKSRAPDEKYCLCDLTTAVLPTRGASPELPSPDSGLTVIHVAQGRGTQNYTCADSTTSSKPVAIGALATLYDASCLVTTHWWLPNKILNSELRNTWFFKIVFVEVFHRVIGKHYFEGSVPFFDFRLAGGPDFATTSVAAKVPPPSNANDGTVDWLQLIATGGHGIKEIYRVETSGGKAPGTCEGMDPTFEVEYTAQYWAFG